MIVFDLLRINRFKWWDSLLKGRKKCNTQQRNIFYFTEITKYEIKIPLIFSLNQEEKNECYFNACFLQKWKMEFDV